MNQNHVRSERGMGQRSPEINQPGAIVAAWLSQHSVTLLRVSLGLVFLVFGVLKFVPGLSPAQDLTMRTVETLSFGLVPGNVGLFLVAGLETAIGIFLLTGWRLRVGVALLGLAMVGIMAPLVLFPGRLFGQGLFAPTLEAQYVLKDVVLVAAGLAVAPAAFSTRSTNGEREERAG